MTDTPPRAHKGRGAGLNPAGRFEPTRAVLDDDGWGSLDAWADEPSPRTEVLPDRSRTVLTRNQSPDIGFDRSVNPYRGCEHGCVYCYARPSHGFLGLSTGLDFETKIFAKHDAAAQLRRELATPAYRPEPIALGTNTDLYQPIERRLGITRAILELALETRHPVTFTTKSALVLRDLDLLRELARLELVSIAVTITTLQGELARTLEPRAAAPHRRLAVIRALAAAGVPVGVSVAPIIPALTDHEIEAIVAAGVEAGARHASWVLLRLPYEIKDLFVAWLETHAPLRAKRVLAQLRASRGGRLNDPEFGSRMRGSGAFAELIAKRMRLARRRCGIDDGHLRLRTDLFRRPSADARQMALL
jgi:DNA repair photolyase